MHPFFKSKFAYISLVYKLPGDQSIKEVNCSKNVGIKFGNNCGFKTCIKEKVSKCKQNVDTFYELFSQERWDQCLCFWRPLSSVSLNMVVFCGTELSKINNTESVQQRLASKIKQSKLKSKIN